MFQKSTYLILLFYFRDTKATNLNFKVYLSYIHRHRAVRLIKNIELSYLFIGFNYIPLIYIIYIKSKTEKYC